MCQAPSVVETRKDASNSASASGGPHYFKKVTNFHLEVAVMVVLWLGVSFMELDVDCGWKFRDVVTLITVSNVVRTAYNAWLEALFDWYPNLRTQPAKKRSPERDVTGRDLRELAEIEWHDRMTMLVKLGLDLGLYWMIGPALYPKSLTTATATAALGGDASAVVDAFLKIAAHHYVLSFGMYFMHRYLHVNTWLWDTIHSKHHYAKTPLARTTYMDHWADNIVNACIAEYATQLIMPLPKPLLFVSRIFRVCESLEKHSGLSGPVNLAHFLQRLFPYAQQPHHHDWHHEGFKGSNFTFSSVGGLWDALFLTRHPGRSDKTAAPAATAFDKKQHALGGKADKSRHKKVAALLDASCPFVLVLFFALAARNLRIRLA